MLYDSKREGKVMRTCNWDRMGEKERGWEGEREEGREGEVKGRERERRRRRVRERERKEGKNVRIKSLSPQLL